MTRHDLTTQIFYKSLFEAAERFYEKDPATALEIYRSFFRYAFGVTDDIVTNNEVAELLVKQTVPNLDISTENYLRACSQGPKGKENGGGIGRPRKGETTEEYQKRLEEWRQNKNPEKPLKGDNNIIEIPENPVKNPVIEKTALQVSQNPEKPLTYTYSLSNTYSKDNINNIYTKEIKKEEKNTAVYNSNYLKEERKTFEESQQVSQKLNTNTKDIDYYFECFFNPACDYSSLVTNIDFFKNWYKEDLYSLKDKLQNKLNVDIPINEIVQKLQYEYLKEKP